MESVPCEAFSSMFIMKTLVKSSTKFFPKK